MLDLVLVYIAIHAATDFAAQANAFTKREVLSLWAADASVVVELKPEKTFIASDIESPQGIKLTAAILASVDGAWEALRDGGVDLTLLDLEDGVSG